MKRSACRCHPMVPPTLPPGSWGLHDSGTQLAVPLFAFWSLDSTTQAPDSRLRRTHVQAFAPASSFRSSEPHRDTPPFSTRPARVPHTLSPKPSAVVSTVRAHVPVGLQRSTDLPQAQFLCVYRHAWKLCAAFSRRGSDVSEPDSGTVPKT
ncbi:hypothetical protein C8Q70DRAFT_963517 [Cubamyces menziesii]|nr:hypothetical protein C8Q70DRAFT_963517 [Cubamyces menziesii]